MPLDSLPTELHYSFIPFLDPISLISLSQTNKHFRLLINPRKKHFVERLLQLETLDEYGGPTPPSRPDYSRVLPYSFQDDWNDIRWACTSCLRLLPRRCFRNRSVWDLAYRKPMQDSPLHNALTTWDPLANTVHKSSIRRRPNSPDNTTDIRMWNSFLRVEKEFLYTEFYENVLRIEEDTDKSRAELSGTNRQNRRCLECQYRRGELRPTMDQADGTARVPIQANRMLLFYSELDRYFPGFSDYLGFQIPTAVENMDLGYNGTPVNTILPMAWTMWMVRCPECTRWKELRNFRVQVRHLLETRYQREGWTIYQLGEDESRENMEALLEDACCNACFAKANGRLQLGRALGRWFSAMIDRGLQQVSSELKWHAQAFHWDVVSSVRLKLRPQLLELKKTVSCFDMAHDSVLNEEDIAQMKAYRAHARCMWEKIDKDERWPEGEHQRPDVGTWAWSHQLCADVLGDLKTCKKLSEENPEAFAAWALDRDESTWDYEVEGARTRELRPDMFHGSKFHKSKIRINSRN